MQRSPLSLSLLASLTLMSLVSVQAQTPSPNALNFQGRVITANGTPPLDGNYNLRLRLYDAVTGGTTLFDQSLTNIPVKNGVFTVILDGFTADKFNGNTWLGISINGAADLSPRTPIVSVPYALKSTLALTVPDGSLTNSKIAAGTLTADRFASGALNSLSWLLGGNSGTNPSSQFMGTTDNQPLVFKTNNAERLRIDASGNIGIGTNAPGGMLHIKGGLSNVGVFVGDLTPFGFAPFETNLSTASTHAWFAENGGRVFSIGGGGNGYFAGNVGIGTETALAKLHVVGGARIESNNVLEFGGGVAGKQADAGKIGYQTFDDALDIVGAGTTNGNRKIKFYNEGGANFAGNVSLPGLQLTTGAGANKILISDANGNASWSPNPFSTNAGGDLTGTYPNPGITANAVSSGKLASDAASLAKVSGGVMINNGGNIGVGTSTPQQNLSIANGLVIDQSGQNTGAINANGGTGNGLTFGSNSGEGIASTRNGQNVNGLDLYTAHSPRISITNDGKVGIGNNFPAEKLDVSGNIFCNRLYQTSDARYKTHIAPLDKALDLLVSLRGVSYDFDAAKCPAKNLPKGRQMGFIAQELETIFPELVTTDKNGYKGIDYVGVVPVLVEAVKTLNARTVIQQKQNDAKDAKIAELEARLERLEAAFKAQK